MPEQISYTAVKAHRGGTRLWIEGAKLNSAGFERGAMYDREVDKETKTLTLTLNPNGKYKTSGRTRNGVDIPIIDMTLTQHAETFPDGTRLRAIFQNGKVTVSVHHEEDAQNRREQRLVDNLKQSHPLTEASACTGGGISTAATHEAIQSQGIASNVAWVVDQEIKYLQSGFAQNFAITDDTVCYEAKLEELEPSLLSEVDVFSFSLPCAGLSKSGSSKHKLTPEQHESGTSVFGIMTAIRAANPSIIWSENVPEAQGSPMYVLIQQELIRRGYHIVEAVLDNRQTKTFENRKRYWFMAISSGLPKSLVSDVFNFEYDATYTKLSQLLDEHVDESVWSENQYLKDKQARDKASGKGFAKRQLLTGDESKMGAIGRFYHKRRSTEPFIVRKDGKERLLSIFEHARAKEVPESLIAKCNMTHGHEILGQGVDYRQAFAPIYLLMGNLKAWLGLDLEVVA